ncbi:MAG TPA: hypothetical protein VKE94_23985, partial [Gemmataceae bacterium]|nr:hypothetical protein [Gemmataceae bacterium]
EYEEHQTKQAAIDDVLDSGRTNIFYGPIFDKRRGRRRVEIGSLHALTEETPGAQAFRRVIGQSGVAYVAKTRFAAFGENVRPIRRRWLPLSRSE